MGAIKIFRTDERDNFDDVLEELRNDPSDTPVDYILTNPVVNNIDEHGAETEYYYLHAMHIRSNDKFVERIGYWAYVFVIFQDGTYCYNEEPMTLDDESVEKDFAEKLARCIKAGTASGVQEEYVDIDNIVF